MQSDEEKLQQWIEAMVEAEKNLPELMKAWLEAWLAAGEQRATWSGWAMVIGPAPIQKKANGTLETDEKRKTA